MLYPKIKKKKETVKLYINDILDDIRRVEYIIMQMIISRDYFVLFMRKCFHF